MKIQEKRGLNQVNMLRSEKQHKRVFKIIVLGNPMNGFKKTTFLKNRPLMKPSPILPNRLKTCPQGDFDMLKWNLTAKTFDSATQTSKLRKTTSKTFIFQSVRRVKPPSFMFFYFLLHCLAY